MSATVLSWATFGAISYVWIWTSKLDDTAGWIKMAFLVANALPGGMLTDIAKTVGLALVERLPGKAPGR